MDPIDQMGQMDQMRLMDPGPIDPAAIDPAKVDTAKVDTAKVDSATVDSAKVDRAHTGAAKIDPAKIDTAKIDAAKPAGGEGGDGGGLHIAMVAPPWYDIPPRGYGGIESMTADLARGLTLRGHRVTLIGAGEGVDLRTYEEPPSERIGEAIPEMVHAAQAARFLDDIEADVIHDHSLAGPLGARGRGVPTIVTCHGEVTGEFGRFYRSLATTVSLVAISWAQRALASDLNWIGRVHNAVDVSTFPYRDRKDDWVLWLGRFNPDKGAHLAIEAARAAGRRILLAGKRTERAEQAYFDTHVEPLLGPDVEYLGEVGAELKRELLSKAHCLIFPLQWEEPFGMIMIEAMACGTPVVALRRGSVPEIVVDGVTGFVRDSLQELPAAIEEAAGLDFAAVRAHAVRRFDVAMMARGYERIYRRAISRAQACEPQHLLPLAR
ncbi:glycosyltransferase family 4 protein [Planotetraspora mira]|uniref:Glycosyl transferase n=1 Tax=Planotetraspora mira TaxID=58121 RepID=A0A8J3TRF0_9ACTN|nr:glycosyltransferase family 4 protein [Planotetraspora mira]GII31748.1 glycosyl transferase [Planotetraspora mira]